MYRNCIFCSAAFGSNAVLETFPTGGQLAFDAAKGRLWAVCTSCSRWNLAPVEERWEAVEAAEKLFVDSRLRVQSENIGLARLPDGTRLIRIGRAVPGEMAAWRYGMQLLRRRRRYVIVSAASVAGGLAAFGGITALGLGWGTIWIGSGMLAKWQQQRVLHRVGDVTIRHWHVEGMSLEYGTDGHVQVLVRDARREKPGWRGHVHDRTTDILPVNGAAADALLGRAMVRINQKGATKRVLAGATQLLSDAGSAERILREAGHGGAALGRRAGQRPEVLTGHWALAVEMAVHESSERRAMEGELAGLKAAWREAEEIAGIADELPGSAVVNRLLARLYD